MEEDKPIDVTLESTIELKSPLKRFIFAMLILIFTFSNFDNGINPAATDEIKKDLGDISDSQLGLFGSADYIGRIISSLIIYSIINTKYRKAIIIFSLILKAVTLGIVYFITNYWVVLVLRGLSGFSQVFFTIYFPVWCDQFGAKKKRTMMISMIHLGCPLGIVLGFVICSLCKKNWILAYVIEGLLLLVMVIVISFIPTQFFSNTLIQFNEISGLIYRESTEEELKAKNNSNVLQNLTKILSVPVFMYTCFANAVSYFAMGVMKFWTPDYMKNVLGVTDTAKITFAYSIISLTGPTLGVIVGGVFGTLIGGYKVRKAILLCILFDLLTCVVGIPSSFVNGFIPYCVLVWLFFFFSTTLLPLETGIALSAVEENVRGDASTVNNFFLNSFGNLPPPFVYGLIKDATEAQYPKFAMQVVFYFRLLGILILIFGSIYRYKLPDEKRKQISKPNHGDDITESDEEKKDALIANSQSQEEEPKE